MNSYVCQHCKSPFQAGEPNRMYCSMACNRARYLTPEERARRFWAKVSKAPHPKGCWLWTGRCVGIGHGIVGRSTNKDRTYTVAHRYAWELAGRTIPEGKWLLHHCDTPNCVLVDHLYIGDRADNIRDIWTRERDKRRLSREKVLAIKAELEADQSFGAIQRIADRHGILPNVVSGIKTGRKYWYYTGQARYGDCSTSPRNPIAEAEARGAEVVKTMLDNIKPD